MLDLLELGCIRARWPQILHGQGAWARDFVGQGTLPDQGVVRFVVCLIAKGRGFDAAAAVLTKGFSGVLERVWHSGERVPPQGRGWGR